MGPVGAKKNGLIRAIGIAAIALAVIYIGVVLTGKSDRVIRLHDDQIDFQKLNNAILQFVIEKGYGYKVERVEMTIKEIRSLISKGDIDVTLELWKANNLNWFNSALKSGKIMDLGVIYSSGRQFWMIPRWFADKHGIRTVQDMKKYWRFLLDPEDPSKGLFFNCIIGWTCKEINIAKLKAYGLDRYYNVASPISPEALEAAFENAQLKKVPIFGYYWEPNTIMETYEWTILKEPAYNEDVWGKVIDAVNRPDSGPLEKACEYGDESVLKIAHEGLIRKAPDIAKVIQKMEPGFDLLNQTLEWMRTSDNGNWEEAAFHYFKNFEHQWRPWVTERAYQRMRKALANRKTAEKG